MKARVLTQFIDGLSHKKSARIIVITGSRQTGKTTLCRYAFPGYTFISVEDPVLRSELARLPASAWHDLYPHAILDEIQKETSLIESVKSVYDQWPDPRYVLTGSSQFLLMDKVRESLAGRCVIIDMYPLTLPELGTSSQDDTVPTSPLIRFFSDVTKSVVLPPSFLLDPDYSRKLAAWSWYLDYGGYPALTDGDLSDDDRFEWLKNYVRTYLERDIRDLASFKDLDAFVKLQRYLANQTATTVNISSMATQLGLSAKTVQRYIRYFEASYQALSLPAWSGNPNKRLVKAPKVHYLDNGVLQAVLQKRGGITGFEFESLVVSEIFKQLRSARIDVPLYHFRTQDGREVDLLAEFPSGYVAFEVKMADRVSAADARHLKGLESFLDKPLLHSFVLSQDPRTLSLAEGVTAVHAGCFLG
jgi:uncharacterized protein